MEKNTGKNVKKTLVRNIKQPIKSNRTVDSIKSSRKSNKTDNKTTTTTTLNVPESNTGRKLNKIDNKTILNVPELNSTLEIARKIDTLRSQTKCTTTTQLTNETLTRRLNFPYEQCVYKNLVPLQTTKTDSQQQYTVVREVLRSKDKEPKLCDFIEPSQKRNEYLYKPSIVRKQNINNSRVDFDPLKLYRILNSY